MLHGSHCCVLQTNGDIYLEFFLHVNFNQVGNRLAGYKLAVCYTDPVA